MSVHAHPDDESSKGAATMAYYATRGRVRVVTCTGGERGDILNPHLEGRDDILSNLAEVRKEEMAKAAEALGVEHRFLGFVDSGLPEGDPLPPLPEGCFALAPMEEILEPLVAEIREFRPQVLITYNEIGGYPHPDHIRTHQASMAAVVAAADPEQFPQAGEPWQVSKVYYDVMFSRPKLETLHAAMLERGIESHLGGWLEDRTDRVDRTVTAKIDVADFFTNRDAALIAHATQIDPEGFFFSIPRDVEKELWPWEEYELAWSNVPVSEDIEDDLFAGTDAEMK